MTRAKRPLSLGLFVVCLAIGLFILARRPAQMPGRLSLIVDTDAGTDDLIALCYLLSRPDVEIRVITTVNGVAHAEAGARNVQRLLRAANRSIDVYAGEDRPLEGRDAFPAAWRDQADEMAALPAGGRRRPPRPDGVTALLAEVRKSESPVSVLALGPLTNIAKALEREPRTLARLEQLVIMGGAVEVAGNAPENAQNPVAEWNMYVDPRAANLVFRSGLPITLVPLDATNRVPIDRKFVAELAARPRAPLGRLAVRLLDSQELIDEHEYYAWDPLAAAALTDGRVVRTRSEAIEVVPTGEERGRTRVHDGEANALVAHDASAAIFRRLLFGAFSEGE